MKKWIDISITLKSGMVRWPSDPEVRIKAVKNMADGDSNNFSTLFMGAHAGTHIDAPLHFLAGGSGIDKMPLDAAIGKARVLEIKDKKLIRPEELARYRIKRGERIIFKTINSNFWAKGRFIKDFVYISPEAARYLARKGVRSVGIDYLSVGAYKKDGAETHKILLKAGIWVIEGLNLDKVKGGYYDLICLPIKILNSEGAPARAALLPL